MPTTKLFMGLHSVGSSPNLQSISRASATAAAAATPSPLVNRPMSDQEREQLDALRQVLPQIAHFDDAYLLRWLRSKEGRFDETAECLKKTYAFRRAWNLDNIDSWVAPEVSGRSGVGTFFWFCFIIFQYARRAKSCVHNYAFARQLADAYRERRGFSARARSRAM